MFDRQCFAAALESHLASHYLPLREAAKQSGISASTLSRLLHGETPDMETFAQLCRWLGVVPGAFFSDVGADSARGEITPLAQVLAALRRDPSLPVAARDRLASLVEAAYQCFVEVET